MNYRWIGAILIMSACSGCGFSIAAGKRKEEKLLCQLIHILQFMEAELRYRLTPLPDLCRLAAGEVRGILRVVFLNLYRELSWQKLPDASSCMSAAIQRTGDIPARVRRPLVQLGQTLGRFDLEGQLREIAAARQYCSKQLDKLTEQKEDRIRQYQTLGLCAGAAAAILLI